MNNKHKEVEEKVIIALCESLALERDEVQKDSRLVNDLDMDSLDFLDIMFSLESEFEMKIRDADFDRVLRPDKSEAALEGEFITDEEINQLAPIIPSLKVAAQTEKIRRRELFSFVTVETLVRMVSRKVLQEN